MSIYQVCTQILIYFKYCFHNVLNAIVEPHNDAKWFSNTLYTNSKDTTTFNLMLISNSGTILTYDLRNCKTPKFYKKELFSKCNNDIHINFDPCNSHTNAISGFDGKVYILEESEYNNMIHKFKHEGHMFSEDGESYQNKITSSSLWLPMCGSNTLLSAANDGSVQGWQFVS